MRLRHLLAAAAVWTAGAGVGAMAAGASADAASPSSSRARELLPPGRYRLEIRMASRLELPRIGEVSGATLSISEAHVRHGEAGVRQRHHVCGLWDASATSWGGIVFPEAFVAALDAPRYAVDLETSGEGLARYRADLGTEHIGFTTSARPAAAPPAALPTDPDDPRVRDWDEDGRPGATVRLRLPALPDAELWIVQRGRARLEGDVVAPGRVEGRVHVVEFAQQVIGARPGFLRRTPRQSPDPDDSRFVLVRMGSSARASGCGDLPARPAALQLEPSS